jgi:hypothetical protein
LSYHWIFNGSPLAGQTNANLTLSGVGAAQAGNYTFEAQNAAGAADSQSAQLIVTVPPLIEDSGQPQSYAATVGEPHGLGVVAAGSAPLSYQWYFKGETNTAFMPVQGGNSWVLPLSPVSPPEAGDYLVYVQNAYGAVTSQVAHITVSLSPKIAQPPASQTVYPGSGVNSITFSATAFGEPPLSYQWMFTPASGSGPATVSGVTGLSLYVGSVNASTAGIYTLIASNSYGTAQANATLAVLVPGDIGT